MLASIVAVNNSGPWGVVGTGNGLQPVGSGCIDWRRAVSLYYRDIGYYKCNRMIKIPLIAGYSRLVCPHEAHH